MANYDQFLEQPPLQTPMIIKGTDTISNGWARWLDKFHFQNSTRNNQVITAADAINLGATYVSVATTTGTYAVTLGAPALPGHTKVIEMIKKTSSYTVTLALTNVVGGTASTTCTFDTSGGSLTLISKSDKWVVLKQYNVTLS